MLSNRGSNKVLSRSVRSIVNLKKTERCSEGQSKEHRENKEAPLQSLSLNNGWDLE